MSKKLYFITLLVVFSLIANCNSKDTNYIVINKENRLTELIFNNSSVEFPENKGLIYNLNGNKKLVDFGNICKSSLKIISLNDTIGVVLYKGIPQLIYKSNWINCLDRNDSSTIIQNIHDTNMMVSKTEVTLGNFIVFFQMENNYRFKISIKIDNDVSYDINFKRKSNGKFQLDYYLIYDQNGEIRFINNYDQNKSMSFGFILNNKDNWINVDSWNSFDLLVKPSVTFMFRDSYDSLSSIYCFFELKYFNYKLKRKLVDKITSDKFNNELNSDLTKYFNENIVFKIMKK